MSPSQAPEAGDGGDAPHPTGRRRSAMGMKAAASTDDATIQSADVAVDGSVPSAGASPPTAGLRGVRQPKWRLCFRMDRKDTRAATEVAWKHQRDFFITVVDPPVPLVNPPPVPPPPFFASEVACQLANLLVGRPFLEHIPGQSFERKSVAAVGPECLTAGLVAAMLGARVVFVSERRHLQVVEQNVRLYLKDTLDYTKTKSSNLTVACAERPGSLSSRTLCDQLSASPALDVIVITESCAQTCAGVRGLLCQSNPTLFDVLDELVPPQVPTKVLLICDGRCRLPEEPDQDGGVGLGAPIAQQPTKGEPLPIEAELPHTWHLRPFCTLQGRFPVVWLERVDADLLRFGPPRKKLEPFRRYLPPMGASNAKCGCGGHPQRNFLNHKVMNLDWKESHHRLKEALVLHNRWKCTENAKELEKAMAWAAKGSRQMFPALEYANDVPAASNDDAFASDEDRLLWQEDPADVDINESGHRAGHRQTLSQVLHDMGVEFTEGEGEEVPLGVAGRWKGQPGKTCPKGSGTHAAFREFQRSRTVEARLEIEDDVDEIGADVSGEQGFRHGATQPGSAETGATAPSVVAREATEIPASPASSSLSVPLPSLRQPSSARSGRSPRWRQIPGRVARDEMKGSTIAQRHSSPPYWYRCNQVPYGLPREAGGSIVSDR